MRAVQNVVRDLNMSEQEFRKLVGPKIANPVNKDALKVQETRDEEATEKQKSKLLKKALKKVLQKNKHASLTMFKRTKPNAQKKKQLVANVQKELDVMLKKEHLYIENPITFKDLENVSVDKPDKPTLDKNTKEMIVFLASRAHKNKPNATMKDLLNDVTSRIQDLQISEEDFIKLVSPYVHVPER